MSKFYFNPDTVKFEKVEISTMQRLSHFIKFFSLVALFAGVIYIVFDDIVESPKLKRMRAYTQQTLYDLSLINRDMDNYIEDMDRIEHNDDHLYRVYFEVNPVPTSQRSAGTGGASRYLALKDSPYSDQLINTFKNLDEVSRRLVVQSRSFDEVIDLAINKEQRMLAKPAIQPVALKDLTRFGSKFGMRFHPILKTWRPHNGIDLTSPRGTKIYATADGVVLQAEYTTGGYGRKILIDHGYGYKTLYGHCNKILVKAGQKVKRGEVIGLVGNTGLSTTPHLHYEVWVKNRPVDPINYYANDLSPEEYDRMINLLSKADPSFDIIK